MSVNSKILKDPAACARIVEYFMSDKYPNVQQTAAATGVTHHTATAVLKRDLPPDVFEARKRANYSRSKRGRKNPMYGLRFDRINMRGGYKARWAGDRYLLEHRRIMMEALGLTSWPEHWQVHHINNDPTDNRLDNLCLATARGHAVLHSQKLERLKLWEKEEFGTSKLESIIATLQGG